MLHRCLFGPVATQDAGQKLSALRRAGTCLAFGPPGAAELSIEPADTWAAIEERFPDGWQPEFAVLDLACTTIPDCFWHVPLPLVGLARDWNLLWHQYRHQLPLCDAILIDLPGIEALARAGITHAYQANVIGCFAAMLDAKPCAQERDIDVLFHKDERRSPANAARRRLAGFRFGHLWRKAIDALQSDWTAITARAERRRSIHTPFDLLGRVWQAVASTHCGDPTLSADLAAAQSHQPQAAIHNALGLVVARAHDGDDAKRALAAVAHYRKALEIAPAHGIARLNLAEALGLSQQSDLARSEAIRALDVLNRHEPNEVDGLDEAHFPPIFDCFRVEWERAAWMHAGDRSAELRAKCKILRWRLHSLLAELTGDVDHHYEAVTARPDLPNTRVGLGLALLQRGKADLAIEHLRMGVGAAPFDAEAARALYAALGAIGDHQGQGRLAAERRLLAKAAPQHVPLERWFAEPAPTHQPPPAAKQRVADSPPVAAEFPRIAAHTSRPRVSLCIIAKNEEKNLADCLAPMRGLVDEIIVADTGSSDRTAELARQAGAKVVEFPWCDSFAAARNESIRHATGAWIFWLDADDRVDGANVQRLESLFANLSGNAAFVMNCLCLPDPRTGTATMVQHVRLFPNHRDIRWEHRVHEQILPAVRRVGALVRWTDIVIQHTGYLDAAFRRQKLERDLRLLEMERLELPDHPFTLFNLGSVYLELGKVSDALPILQHSLELSQPGDSIVRKLYTLIIQCRRHLGQWDEAMAVCRTGRAFYPKDAELLFHEALVRREGKDLAGAETCLRRLLAEKEGPHFASVDTGLRGYKARHNLAVIVQEQGRVAEAQELWQAALAERPEFIPARVALAELYLNAGRWHELDATVQLLEQAGLHEEARMLRVRSCLVRKDYTEARRQVADAALRFPRALWPRLFLSRTLLQEGKDYVAAEQALRDVLALDAQHPEARRNLAVLLRQRGQPADEKAAA